MEATMHFSPKIRVELRSKFPEHLRAAAQEALPRNEGLLEDAPYERVVLAIIKLSSGNLDKLSRFSEDAKKDWRDVLYWAEYPREVKKSQSWEELKAKLQHAGKN